ncbi:MAG: dihydroorotate dehydrogenase-like protein [Candidatus Aminicenantes bacterium]|nr:dihydroorotate dehydrogenase-like protein [Candidatus Aminicenantes bacterium]
MADTSTSYMGLEMKNPVLAASSGLTDSLNGILKCDAAGVGGVVLKSIFEEQLISEKDVYDKYSNIYPEAVDYLREGGLLEYAPQKIFQMIDKAKQKTDIPIIASINCRSPKLWPTFAEQFQDAGADGLELNIYSLPLELEKSGSEYEQQYLDILKSIKKVVSIPVAVKLNHQITSLPYLTNRLSDAGCDGLVFFNWFLEPDVRLDTLSTNNIKGKGDFHRTLRWVALLAGRIDCDISSSGGVRNGKDLIKHILAGASCVQICTIFYEKGLEQTKEILNELKTWMDEKKFQSIQEFQGELSLKNQQLSFKDMGEAQSYFRAQYLKTFKK